ncbi:MAG: YMGG-like glycine zipper-containing protein [Halioglobus sp.]
MKSYAISLIGIIGLALAAPQAMAMSYNDSPMVDIKPGQEVAYQNDLEQCKAVISSNNQSGKSSSRRLGLKSGAMVGALGGAAVGRASGDSALRSAGKGAAWGAAAGGVAGNVAGDFEGRADSGYAVRRCLEGRGYVVLDYSREDRRIDNGDYGRPR